MEWTLFTAAFLSVVAWAYLLLMRGWFWHADQELDVDYPDPDSWPEVVVLVPARNEATVLREALESLLTQDYQGKLHVILIDDESEDGTSEAARVAARACGELKRLTIIHTAPRPAGWTGKLWALHQGRLHAAKHFPEAGYLWLSDADIAHWGHNLGKLVAKAEAEELDMVSLMASLSCESPWERLLIPPFVFFFQKLYPFPWVNDPDHPLAAAAGGCVLVRSEALAAAGGFEAIKDDLIDDCALARLLKAGGRKGGRGIWLGLSDEAHSIRRYDELGPIWDMVARTAYTQLGHKPWMLAVTVLGMLVVYLAPPLAVLIGLYSGMFGAVGSFGLVFLTVLAGMVGWGLMVYAALPTLTRYDQPVWAALLLPVAALFYTAMTIDSARRYHAGRGGSWKGRSQAARASLE